MVRMAARLAIVIAAAAPWTLKSDCEEACFANYLGDSSALASGQYDLDQDCSFEIASHFAVPCTMAANAIQGIERRCLTAAFVSGTARYCVLVSTEALPTRIASPWGQECWVALYDCSDHMRWRRLTNLYASPRIADLGTCALASQEGLEDARRRALETMDRESYEGRFSDRDAMILSFDAAVLLKAYTIQNLDIQFVDSAGRQLGTCQWPWRTLGSFAVACGGQVSTMGSWGFITGRDELIVIRHPARMPSSKKATPSILECYRSDGDLLWSWSEFDCRLTSFCQGSRGKRIAVAGTKGMADIVWVLELNDRAVSHREELERGRGYPIALNVNEDSLTIGRSMRLPVPIPD